MLRWFLFKWYISNKLYDTYKKNCTKSTKKNSVISVSLIFHGVGQMSKFGSRCLGSILEARRGIKKLLALLQKKTLLFKNAVGLLSQGR